MENLIPSFADIIRDLLVGAIAWLAPYLWRKYIQKIDVRRMPAWSVQGLILYFIITICIYTYNYYQLHKPLEQHRNEVFDHQTIVLDGKAFENCSFINSLLVIEGKRRFELNHPILTNTQFKLDKRANIGLSILALMKEDKQMEPYIIDFYERLKTQQINYSLPSRSVEDL